MIKYRYYPIDPIIKPGDRFQDIRSKWLLCGAASIGMKLSKAMEKYGFSKLRRPLKEKK